VWNKIREAQGIHQGSSKKEGHRNDLWKDHVSPSRRSERREQERYVRP